MDQHEAIAYKTWVENLQEPAPEGAWDAIADQLDIDTAWDGISETLDLDDVWKNIETELPQTVPVSSASVQTHFPKLLWIAAALILLTLTTPLTDDGYHRNNNTQARVVDNAEKKTADQVEINPKYKPKAELNNEVGKQYSGIKQSATSIHLSINNQTRSESPGETSSGKAEAPASLITQRESALADETINQREKSLQDQFLNERLLVQPIQQKMDTLEVVANTPKADSILTVASLDQPEDSAQRNQSVRAKWQIGVIGSLKNTWLINPETTNGLKRSSLNDTRLTFGKEFGITLQRSIGASADLQVEYYFYSQIGQRYHEYINALYQTKDVRLKYQKFQLVYRTRVWRKSDAPALYAVGGMRISRLTLADTSIGNENQEVTQEYRPWDYGFILGGEAEFKLNSRMLLVSGVRASYGLRNIYLGTDQAPADFNKTHTASVGLMIGLKYCFY